MTFNPNTPGTLGVEWFPTVKAGLGLSGGSVAGAVLLDASVTETVDALWVYLSSVGGVGERGSGWEIEVYQASNLGVLDRSVTTHVPDLTVFNRDAFAWGPFASSGTLPGSLTVHQGIDSYPAQLFAGKGTWPNSGQPVDNDEFLFPIYGLGCEAAFRFSGLVGVLTGKRIVRVTVAAYVQEYVAKGVQHAGIQVTPFVVIDGQRVNGETETRSGERAGGHYVAASWWANPVTKGSWRVSDVEQFDSTVGGAAAGWTLAPTGTPNDLPTILQGWLAVETTDELTDPREAVGVLTDSSARIGWNRIPVTQPDGTPWVKSASTTYLVVLRRRYGTGTVSWRYLDAALSQSMSHITPVDVTISPDTGFPIGWSTNQQTRMFSLLCENSVGDTSVDSQPYAHVAGDIVPQLGLSDDWTVVDTATPLYQEFTTGPAGSYTWLRALVRAASRSTDGPLTATITTVGGVPQGSPLVIQPSDLDEPRDAWQIIEGPIGGPLLGATQYQVRFTSTASVGTGWHVQVLSPQLAGTLGGPPADVEDATFNAGVDAAWPGAVRRDELDVCVTVATQPAPPSGFAATVVGETACVDGVILSWTPTALGTDFLRYEIERNDTGVWRRIAEITDESIDTMTDWESRRNTVCAYRMRVRRVDQSPSDWTPTQSATPTMGCCGYALTSNVEPDLNTWVDDATDGERLYEFQPTETARWFHNRDYPVVFGSLERRGVRFETTLLLAAEGGKNGTQPATTPGITVFDRLRAFSPSESGAGLPYVCVTTRDGDRWFAWLKVESGLRKEPGGAYSVKATVWEVTDVPSPIDVAP